MFGIDTIVFGVAASAIASALFSLLDWWFRGRRNFKVRIGRHEVELIAGDVQKSLDRLRPLIEDLQEHPRVFLSYTSSDREFAEKLMSDLERSGIPVWFADREIKVGDKLLSRIANGIDESQWVIAILSPEAVSSSWFRQELQIALRNEKVRKRPLILPVLYKGEQPPTELTGRVFADFRQDYSQGFNPLLDAIRKLPRSATVATDSL